MKKTTFYVVRHGETEWNKQSRILGQSESALTEKGEAQARELREEFKNIQFDAVFSSDLLRAKRTADIISSDRHLEVRTTPLLREKRMGKYEGAHANVLRKDNEALAEAYKKLTDDEKWKFKRADTMESMDDICARMLTFFREAAAAYVGKTLLVVSHEAVLQTLLVYAGWGTAKEIRGGSVENGGYIQLTFDGKVFSIENVKGVTKKLAKRL